YIVRLQIAMNNVLFVSALQSITQLLENRQCSIEWKRFFSLEKLIQVDAVNVFEDEKRLSAGQNTEIINSHYIRVVQLTNRFSFSSKTFHALGKSNEMLVKHFDRYESVERKLPRFEHNSPSAATKQRYNRVLLTDGVFAKGVLGNHHQR